MVTVGGIECLIATLATQKEAFVRRMHIDWRHADKVPCQFNITFSQWQVLIKL